MKYLKLYEELENSTMTFREYLEVYNIDKNTKNLRLYDTNLSDLDGIEKLTNLSTLFVMGDNYITNINKLPESLKVFYISGNKTEFTINNIDHLDNLYHINITQCWDNIKKLPKLPNKLEILELTNTHIEEYPELPDSIKVFSCDATNMKVLPKLPNGLEILNCHNNYIKVLPELPPKLKVLSCSDNEIRLLPELPKTLELLYIDTNKISYKPNKKVIHSIDKLDKLKFLYAGNNKNLPFTDLKNYKKWIFKKEHPHLYKASKYNI